MSKNLTAILAMVFAMAVLAFSDALIKVVAQSLPIAQILVIISALGALGFAIILKLQRQAIFPKAFFHPKVLARNLAEAFAGFCMLSALAITPLTTVTAIIQAVPVLVTIGAVLILKEKVGLRRWGAVALGLIGVLVILRPGAMEGAADIAPGMLLALGAAAGLALRDVLTRAVPKGIQVTQLAAWGMGFNIPAGLMLMSFQPELIPLQPKDIAILIACVCSVMAGYFAVITSVRMAEVSIVVPFRYTRLPFGILLGMWFFGERLDAWTILGACIIVAAGLYIMQRERKTTLSNPH